MMSNSIRRLLPTAQAFVVDDVPPVVVTRKKWITAADPGRLVRDFRFEDVRVLKAFISEILDMEHVTFHSGKITVSGKEVRVEVWTHDVNDVTLTDIRYAKSVDEIEKDVRRYFTGA